MHLAPRVLVPPREPTTSLHARSVYAAHGRTTHAGLSAEDREDCEGGFALRMVAWSKRTGAAPTDAWLSRCAANYVRNFVRGLSRRKALLAPWGAAAAARAPAAAEPLHALLQHEAQTRLAATTDALTDSQFNVLLRHLDGQTASEIGAATGRSAHAIEQCLSNVRRRLRKAWSYGGGPDDRPPGGPYHSISIRLSATAVIPPVPRGPAIPGRVPPGTGTAAPLSFGLLRCLGIHGSRVDRLHTGRPLGPRAAFADRP